MSSNKIVLISVDGESFEIDKAVARQFHTISPTIDCADEPIPLLNVTGKILALAIEYCKKHVHDNDSTNEDKKELVNWDAEFLENKDLDTLFSLILAANYLNAKGLLDFTCQNVADRIKDKTVEEIREIFGMENDFTPEEEAAIRMENEWVFH